MHEQKYEIEEKNIKQPELKYPNSLDNALIVVSNLIARASTKWTLEETKMFLCMVSKVKTRDRDNWVTVSKKDLAEKTRNRCNQQTENERDVQENGVEIIHRF